MYSHFSNAAEEAYSSVGSGSLMLLAGDFNQPNTDWENLSIPEVSPSSRYLIEMANFLHLTQINDIHNDRGVTLDLIFSSDSNIQVSASDSPLLQLESAHPALIFDCQARFVKSKQEAILVPNLRKCKLEDVYRWIQGQEYPKMSSSSDVEGLFTDFCNKLRGKIVDSSPWRSEGGSSFPRWFSGKLKALIIKKKHLHGEYKRSNSADALLRFKELRSQCKQLSRRCHMDYLSRVDADLILNPKNFWNHIKNIKGDSTSLTTLTLNDKVADEPSGICDVFADYFSSVYKAPSNSAPSYHYDNTVALSTIQVTALDIEKKLKTLDVTKGPGPDEIPAMVLRYCSEVLAPHLAIFFNTLLSRGIFPSCLKTGFIIPIHKSGNRTNVQNYRPIVIQSALAKVFESTVLDVLSFTFRNIIIPEQHGFHHGRSTSTNLVLFTNEVLASFSDNSQLDCVYLDYSRAFDRISHPHLLKKLHALGIEGPLLQWFQSYLSGRSLQVRHSSALSKPICPVSGVPQGTHLGPFLFKIFINDIKFVIRGKFLLFADDIKLFRGISSDSDALDLQEDLRAVEDWCLKNEMELNPKKCAVVTFARIKQVFDTNYLLQGVALTKEKSIRDLGVILNSRLEPAEHIHNVCNKAARTLGLVHRTTCMGLSIQSMRTLYVTLVRPLLEYSAIVWSPYQVGHCLELENIQRRLLRMVGVKMGYRYLDVDVKEMQQLFHLPPLSVRRSVMDLVFLYKVLNGLIDCPEILACIDLHVPRQTRHPQLFTKHQSPTSYLQNSTIPRLLRTGNKVCAELDFFSPSADVFKREALAVLLRSME